MLCPFCKEEIKDGAILCKFCKSNLSGKSEDEIKLAPTVQQTESKQFIESSKPYVSATINTKKRKLLPIIIGVVVAIAVALVLAWVLLGPELNRGKLKATMGDMKSIGSAIESYITDWSIAPQVQSIEDLSAASWFVPFYIKVLPTEDGWGNKFLYLHGQVDTDHSDLYAVASSGSDGRFEGFDQSGKYFDWNDKDIIYSNGEFTYGPDPSGEYSRNSKKAQKVATSDIEEPFKRGHAYYDEGKYDEAIAEYTKAIEINPNDADAYYFRGQTYSDKNMYDQAIIDFTKAIELNPENVFFSYNLRGRAYYHKKSYDQAISDLNKAIELNPDKNNPKIAIAYLFRGRAYSEKDLKDQAISDFNKAIELDPQFESAYFSRGEFCYYRGLLDQAIQDFTKAIELNPKNDSAYLFRGRAYHMKDLDDQAISDLNPTRLQKSTTLILQGNQNCPNPHCCIKGLNDETISICDMDGFENDLYHGDIGAPINDYSIKKYISSLLQAMHQKTKDPFILELIHLGNFEFDERKIEIPYINTMLIISNE